MSRFHTETGRRRMSTWLAVLLTLLVVIVPISSYDSEATDDDYYSYTIYTNGTISGYDPIGVSLSSGSYTSVNGTNSGSWAFNDEGYGPFNSFYAAFDPAQNNRMIGHLDPDDLTKLVNGTSIAGQNYNIMWCLPTVYWYTSGSDLVLTNDPDSGGEAYAHTINGHVYEYIGIGVYEASTASVGGSTILMSATDSNPLVDATGATFRDYANNQTVNTDGEGQNGYAMVWNFYQWELYKYCALAVMGSWNSQGVAGNGDVYGGSPYYHITGDHDKSGPYAGTKGSGTSYCQDSVKVFIENAWGSVYDFVDGVVISEREYYIDQSAVPTDATSGTYITNPSGRLPESSGYGSIPSTEAAIWGMPTATGGSASSGLYDYYDYAHHSDGRAVICVGGYKSLYSSDTSNYGLSYLNCFFTLSSSNYNLGGRLAFVFDADPTLGNTVTFDHSALTGAGGSASGLATSVLVPTDESYQLPNLGTVGGYTHAGWLIDGIFRDIGYVITPTGNMTIRSLWQVPTVTITMMVEGSVYATLSVPVGSSGVVFTPENVNGVFTGWFYDPGFTEEYVPYIPIDSDLTLYAKGVPPLTFTTDPIANGDIVALDGQPGTISYRATDSMYYSSVLWDFGDGSTSTDLYATHYYSEPGTYTATLTVYNNYGSDAMEFIIEVPADHSDDGIPWALYIAVVVAVVLIVVFVVTRVL